MAGRGQRRLRQRAGLALAVMAVLIACSSAASASSARAHSHRGAAARAGWHLHRAHGQRARLRHRSRRAHGAIVGGSSIAIAQAPWQVSELVELEGGGELLCGGAVLDSTHILTAGHCAINPETEEPVPAKAILVIAGTATLNEKLPTAQVAEVEHVRIHPGFNYAKGPGTPDDVAVLTLETPLESTASVKPISLGSGFTTEGTALHLTGFGLENPGAEEPDGLLHALSLSSLFPRSCGGEADALFICAATPTGSACSGDSGSALTSIGPEAVLLGVADFVGLAGGEVCGGGATDGFVNVAAPEVKDFIEGSESPPTAPRGGGVVIKGFTHVGSLLTCLPGSWTHSPTFTYSFIAGGQILAKGLAGTYLLTQKDVGREFSCEVAATNSGGTGVVRTTSLPPIEGDSFPSETAPGPTGPTAAPEASTLELLSARLAVKRGTALLSIRCSGGLPCHGKVTLSVSRAVRVKGHLHRRSVVIATAGISLAAKGQALIKLALNQKGKALLKAAGGHLGARLTLLGVETAPTAAVQKPVRLIRG